MPWVLTPPLAYMIEAQRIMREMAAEGVVLTPGQAQELAHASLGPEKKWQAQEPVLSEQANLILDRIVAERRRMPPASGCTGCAMGGHRHWPCTRPEPDTPPEPDLGPRSDILDHPQPTAVDHGQGDTAARQQQQNCGEIDPIKRYLRDVPDPEDGEWTA
jgi:hypothetical protein